MKIKLVKFYDEAHDIEDYPDLLEFIGACIFTLAWVIPLIYLIIWEIRQK